MGIPAKFSFPGIAQVMAGTVNFGHGITPTGFQLTIVPQPSNVIVEIADLTLEYNNETLVFKDCRADQAAYSFDANGNVIALTILDRRWRWQFGRISGEYNVRREDNTIEKIDNGDPAFAVEDSERTPQQLARLLLTAAGETVAADAVNELPNDTLPYVNWDVANPMSELANLCDMLGCRVVLGLDNVVRVRKLNVGQPLPPDGLMRYGASVDYFNGPDQVSVVSAPVRYQHDFELEAVGLDVDGSVKLLDDLSYVPEGGWGSLDIFTGGVLVDLTSGRSLAHKSVFRWYRVKVPFELPGYGLIKHRSQIILLGSQVFKTQVDGVYATRDRMVYGIYFTESDFVVGGNSRDEMAYLPDAVIDSLPEDDERTTMIVTSSFSIDSDRAIVMFTDHVYKTEGDDYRDWAPATLRLRTTCLVRDAITRGLVRGIATSTIRNVPQPVTIDLRHEEIQPYYYAKYSNDFAVTQLVTNENETALEVNHYLNEAVTRLSLSTVPQDGLYAGWVFNVDLDGAIQSITWSLSAGGDQGPTTRIERAQDTGGMSGIPYKLRRQYQKQAEAERKSALAEFKTRETRELAKVEGLY